jgi:hypothetical protein
VHVYISVSSLAVTPVCAQHAGLPSHSRRVEQIYRNMKTSNAR